MLPVKRGSLEAPKHEIPPLWACWSNMVSAAALEVLPLTLLPRSFPKWPTVFHISVHVYGYHEVIWAKEATVLYHFKVSHKCVLRGADVDQS